jgi:hypothetical protein
MTKLVLTILLTAAFSFGVFAQTETSSVKDLQSAARKFKNKKRYVVKYDETAGQTNVFFHYAILKGTEEDTDDKFRTGIGAGFFFPGQAMPAAVEEFGITLTAGQGWSFLSDRRVSVTADGKSFELEEGVRDSSVERSLYDKKRTGEILIFKLKRADLETLASAARVEMRLSGKNYLLKPEHQQIFKNILSLGRS